MIALSAPIDLNYSKLNYTAMKHFNLLKTTLLLCALIVGSLSGWAQSDYSADHTGNVTLSTTGGTQASLVKVKIDGMDYNAVKIGKNGDNGNFNITAPAGTKYLHIHVAAWKGKSPTLTVKNGSTTIASNISLTSDGNISGSSTTFDLAGQAKVTTDYYKLVVLSSALSESSSINISTSNERAVVWGITTEAQASGITAAPSISGATSFLGSATVTISNDASADGASIYYTLNGSEPTTTTSETCFAYSAPFTIDATTTVKAIAKKSTDSNASSVVSKTFTKVVPKTVAEAITAIDAASPAQVNGVYVKGIISKIDTYSEGKYITYWISDDGLTTNQFEVYKGLGIDGAAFSGKADLEVGDEVVIYGNMKKYSGTYEFVQDNQIFNMIHKTAPSFALDVTEKTLDAYTHETVDVTLTTNTDGDVTCESSNPDVATVALKSAGVYTITAQSEGSATITIKSATSATYKPASASVAVTVEDGRADAGISFAEADIEKTWGESFTGQALTNTNSVDVTYSSTDESVATVSSTGVVAVLKAGSTTIKATFAGNATYKAAVASYELTINKAEAGLSFVETEFDVDLNDDSFVAPVLNNPNSLTVTYTSSNDNVAVVDENTGELLLETNAEGTVTITATFAGNDNFKSGNASYTITITDPNRKGTKKNPYTVAEVISGAATGSGIYVRGVIVGEFVGKTTDPRTSKFTTDANIALADAYTASPSCSSTIPVAMTNNSQKNLWGNQTNKGTTMGYEVIVKGNKDSYFSVNGIKSTSEVIGVSAPVTISGAGFATYASNVDLDFTGITGLKVYKATVSGTTISFDKITTVPAGEGVLLQGDEGTYEVPVISGVTPWDDDDNAFVRGTGAAVATGDGPYNYILNKVNGVVGFYKANLQTVAKNRAYLQSTTAAARISLNFDEETTGVSEVGKSDANNKVLDLQGRHIAQPTKGLYIMNGRKVLVK